MRRAILNTAMGAVLLAAPATVLAAGGHGGMGGGMGGGFNSSMSSTRPHGLTPTTTTPSTVRGPSQTGQPKQSCQATNPPNFPGGSGSAPGSAFNGTAGSHYAGNGTNNNMNTASVSQYDVACTRP